MKKSTDEELNAWRYRFPSAFVSQRIIGDKSYASHFLGEAQLLLYRVKNAMQFNNLKQHRGIQYFDDGTVITAKSIFGQDYIEINVTQAILNIAASASCSVTLINVPIVVPPMKWYYPWDPESSYGEKFTKVGDAWEIRTPNGVLEVEGVDYIKTYYKYSTIDCPSCGKPEFTLAEHASNIEYMTPNRPFWYKAENDDGSLIYNYNGVMVPHDMGDSWQSPPRLAEPMSHTIYSFWGCNAEIIKFDHDDQGTYFLWKAYTEWSNIGPYTVNFSRTGLGYMLLKGFIGGGTKDPLYGWWLAPDSMLCESDPVIVKVDCCEKPEVERQVKLWWEHGSGPFMFYGTMKLYEVPPMVLLWALYYYACTPGGIQFYTFPETIGSCIPMEWEVDGRGKVEVWPHPHDNIAGYLCPTEEEFGPTGCSDVTITVKDRCGTEDKVLFTCCDYPGMDEISIGYTSLSMGCGQEQELTGGGGCPPYSWSFTGNGTLDVNGIVTYTAPPDNPNCGNNDTVTLTDCCGNSASITIYVSCYNAGLEAFRWTEYVGCHCFQFEDPDCAGMAFQGHGCTWLRKWDCYGTLYYDVVSGVHCPPDNCPEIPPPPPCINFCTCWEVDYDDGCKPVCPTCESYVDKRTTDMKEAGCCPINPSTGLPF